MRKTAATALLLALLLAGVTSSAQPDAGLRVEVPFVRQVKQGCGSAAIAMVMQWWKRNGHPVKPGADDAAVIHGAVYRANEQGTRARDVARYFERQGFRTFSFSGTWSDLSEHLSKGRPLIVAVRPTGQRQLHYVVVSGAGRDRVLLHDPAEGAYRALSRPAFETQWAASERYTLLALPAP